MAKYELFHHKLASVEKFRGRLINGFIKGTVLVIISLLIGILGYHSLAGLNWVDSFLNASMILGGMGPVDMIKDDAAKIFAGCYALFSGIMFLSGFAIFIAPILHRVMHKFHISDTEKEE